MKKIIGFFTILFLTNIGYSQNDTATIYVDVNGLEISQDEAKYISKRFNENGKWIVNDYYLSGELQMTGTYTSNKYKVKHGDFTYYYPNGNIQMKGSFINNKKSDQWTAWEETGEIHEKGDYVKGEFNGIMNWYYEGYLCSVEEYKGGKMLKYTFYDKEGNKLPENTDFDQYPEFPGGIDSLLAYIKQATNYPVEAKRNNLEGKVFVDFVINKQGKIINAKAKNKVNELLEKEAIRVVENMPNWKPGMQRNIPVEVIFTIPINFKL